MQIRLYLDEDSMSKALAHNLRLRGIDVTTVGLIQVNGGKASMSLLISKKMVRG